MAFRTVFRAPDDLCKTVLDYKYKQTSDATRSMQFNLMRLVAENAQKELEKLVREKKAKGELEKVSLDKHPDIIKLQEIHRRRMENTVVYVHTAIQIGEGNGGTLFEFTEQALKIDKKSNDENTCTQVRFWKCTPSTTIPSLAPKTYLIYQPTAPASSEEYRCVVQEREYFGLYFDANKRRHPIPVTDELKNALDQLPTSSNVDELTYDDKDVAPIYTILNKHHIATYPNTLDPQSIFVRLAHLRKDVEKDVVTIQFNNFGKSELLKHIDQLGELIFTKQLHGLNQAIVSRPPDYPTLLSHMPQVSRANTRGWFSGNQDQLKAFIRILDEWVTTNPDPVEQTSKTPNADPRPYGQKVRSGALLYFILMYEQTYWRRWDFFEKSKQVANITLSSRISNETKFEDLTALGLHIASWRNNQDGKRDGRMKDFAKKGLHDPLAFLNDMQKEINRYCELFNNAAQSGVANPRVNSWIDYITQLTSDAFAYVALAEMGAGLLGESALGFLRIIASSHYFLPAALLLLQRPIRSLVTSTATSTVSPFFKSGLEAPIRAAYNGAVRVASLFSSSPTQVEENEEYVAACLEAPFVPEEFKQTLRRVRDYQPNLGETKAQPEIPVVAARRRGWFS